MWGTPLMKVNIIMMLEYHLITPSYLIGIILAMMYSLLFIIEHQYPLRHSTRPLLSRVLINLILTVFVYITANLFIAPLIQFALKITADHHIGLLSWIPMSDGFRFVLGFLLLDVTFYYWHRLNHEIPLLWRFHNVHHTDPDLDVTTSMRFHPVEIAYSSLFRFIQLTIVGINPITLICYEFVFQFFTFFQHSNIKLPINVERRLNKVFVTPRMHGIHHSNYQDETNQNYSVVFSFWDRIHQTMTLNIRQQSITIGVPEYQQPTDNTMIPLLLMPIKKQADYWEGHHHRALKPIRDDIKTLLE
jgi:sterol desaturase/sphingolipid hydroxylase (fatty acid hydroxylase superfamily)